MFKMIDHTLNRYAPWSYLLLIFAAIAFAALVRLNLVDGATGMAINVCLFGLGMSGVLAWRKESEDRLVGDSRRRSGQQDGADDASARANQTVLALDARIPLIRFIFALLLMMAAALLFAGVQFLSTGHGLLASLAMVADIRVAYQTSLAGAACVVGITVAVLGCRAWWAFEQWLASAKVRSTGSLGS
jgi:hypothetical protein